MDSYRNDEVESIGVSKMQKMQTGTISVTNTNTWPVKVHRWVIGPGKTIEGIPLSFKDAFLKHGCEIRDIHGNLLESPGFHYNADPGATPLFAFESVDTSLEYSKGISVVIPSYNRAEPLRKAALSVIEQRYPYCEVVIVDDGSADNTINVIPQIRDAARANQVLLTYILVGDNHGIAAARNLGTLIAKHDNIIMLDSDDVLLPSAMSRLAEALSDNSVDVVYGKVINADGSEYDPPEWKRGRLTNAGCYILGVRAFRKRLWEFVGGFDETLGSSEDLDILIRFEDVGAIFKKLDVPLCRLGDYGDRITATSAAEVNNNASEARGRAILRRKAAWTAGC